MNDSISGLMARLAAADPLFWRNPGRDALDLDALRPPDPSLIRKASDRLRRFAPLLSRLFPELLPENGLIESSLLETPSLRERFMRDTDGIFAGRVFVKTDHALPVAGSIKARGGVYAVLRIAEDIAFERRLISGEGDDYVRLAEDEAVSVFQRYRLSTGSTGNLGLAVGIMARALGFAATVHMSADAKAWKKNLLRNIGALVVEHPGDYAAACAKARAEAAKDPLVRFIDDENSEDLFLGYAVAGLRLKDQLEAAGVCASAEQPLVLHLPCGVGGAPGGAAFGALHSLGARVHCLLAEPVAAPCMLLGLASGKGADISVADIGLDGKTRADGLAVARPSRFVSRLMANMADGCFTVTDDELFLSLLDVYETENLEVEPSSAAVFRGALRIARTDEGRAWARDAGLGEGASRAVHIFWTSGGALVSPRRHAGFRKAARKLRGA